MATRNNYYKKNSRYTQGASYGEK